MKASSQARKIYILNHRKKQAANDAQLLMNRIALLQKEEERARKKIDQTKERAGEILAMRDENERRMKTYIEASNEEKAMQRELQERNKEMEIETKRTLASQAQKILNKRREEAHELNMEKRNMTKQLIKEQERELRLKQKKRDEVRRLEEEARLRKEEEKRESDRRMREMYEKKAQEEEEEAKRAEKLVRALEKKEREWMLKLQDAQRVQESAFTHLESALLRDLPSPEGSRVSNGAGGGGSGAYKNRASGGSSNNFSGSNGSNDSADLVVAKPTSTSGGSAKALKKKSSKSSLSAKS